MKQFTFQCVASVSVDADTEEKARQKLSYALYTQYEDVLYGDPSGVVASVYVTESLVDGESAVLTDVCDYEVGSGEFL